MKVQLAKVQILNKKEAPKHAYEVARSFKHENKLYKKGEKVKLNDKFLLRQFLRNNYVK